MPGPASYADLGKAARDVFSKGFHFGQYKLEAKTKTSSGVEFTTTGSSAHESGAFAGSLETKYKWSDYGATFTEKWNTDNVLQAEISVEDQLVKGLKLSLDTNFAPQSGKKGGKVKTEYKHDYVHTNLDLDLSSLNVFGSAVVGYNGWLAGYQLALDTSKTAKSLLSQSNFAIGYSKDDLTLHTAIINGSEYQGTIFHKVNSRLESAVALSWTSGSHETRFAVGAKYNPDKDSTIRAKLNNASQLGLSYQHKIRDGVSLTLSTQIEGKHLNQGGHKFGIALDFEA
jgi:voltage-dependent anion channel protein 2